ncbi:hypothetical protein HBI56_045790 [Parastagonospora nodorum]|uniref:Uncharacterized protein n=1 Tax=Phaeosphaeria nodorum (strain SN15 / ATCC MYA-4574 / FGSC 10173) TaxID=321614 RepID=A0A7U2ERJ2_PHANO|nr:hypothetical protein HBH56_058940 [Parastagonospora nodorum]QRC91765.1 hypothetical protein JI435_401650 [Parastagonospora nodorum SN15]KAH3931144.1 hypothetical protein HBH54_102870 [Parastagonospora nodorum]KAH3943842.1 hypothetical protein HBH53_166600 [Parastagonospora nodorum]KAH3965397.1 hypothetical protein HBH51_151620 [Parastagonospora nodorum]
MGQDTPDLFDSERTLPASFSCRPTRDMSGILIQTWLQRWMSRFLPFSASISVHHNLVVIQASFRLAPSTSLSFSIDTQAAQCRTQ